MADSGKRLFVMMTILVCVTLLAMATSSPGATRVFNAGYALAGAWPYVHPLLIGLLGAILSMPVVERLATRFWPAREEG